VKSTKTLFYPQDLDKLASNTGLSFVLSRPATVTWTIRNASGTIVDTLIAGEARVAGTYSKTFSGRRLNGTMLPVGTYTSYVSARDGEFTAAQAVKFQMNAFGITSSTSTPRRGRSVTITAQPAESMSGTVSLSMFQPGLSTWSVKMTKLSSGRYRASVTLKSGGSSGIVSFRVMGTDSAGKLNKAYLKLPLS
jgi:hypothetical protein